MFTSNVMFRFIHLQAFTLTLPCCIFAIFVYVSFYSNLIEDIVMSSFIVTTGSKEL
jgi:hypothetical protein